MNFLTALLMLGVCESFCRGLPFLLDYQRYLGQKKVKNTSGIPRAEPTRPLCFCTSMTEFPGEADIIFPGSLP
jgi:hypothetical protein